MLISSRYDKPVPITLLSDVWLVLSLPIMLINVASFTLRRTLVAAVFAMLRAPALFLLKVLSQFSWVNTPALIGVYALTLLLAKWRSADSGWLEGSFWVILLAVLTITVVELAKRMIDFRDGNRSDLVLSFSQFNRIKKRQTLAPFPPNLIIPELSQSAFLGSLMVTLFALVNVLFLLIGDNSGFIFWAPLVALLALFLLDFEMIEHLASHSPKGKLVRRRQPSGDSDDINGTYDTLGYLLYALEQLRIYLVWPMFFWPPGRYVLTHTYHHHIENNGPTDWQSTQRFNLSSVFDFSQSLLWLQISVLCPIDTLRYFQATGKNRQAEQLIVSTLYHWALLAVLLWWKPVLVLALFGAFVAMAWIIHAFIFAWHGFHDAAKPFDIAASNNSERHYSHHKAPGEHLLSPTIQQRFEADFAEVANSESSDTHFPVHLSSDAMTLVTRHWLLVQCVLWQKKFSVIRNLVDATGYDEKQLKRLVEGAQLKPRNAILAEFDQRLSASFGRLLERSLCLITPQRLRVKLLTVYPP